MCNEVGYAMDGRRVAIADKNNLAAASDHVTTNNTNNTKSQLLALFLFKHPQRCQVVEHLCAALAQF